MTFTYYQYIIKDIIKDKYIEQIKAIFGDLLLRKESKIFIFGSCLEREHFGDIDIGALGKISEDEISSLKEFKDNVFKNKIIWLTQST